VLRVQFTYFSSVQPLESDEQATGYTTDYVEEAGVHPGYTVDASASLEDHPANLASAVGTDMFSLTTQSLSYIDQTTGQTTIIQMQPPSST